MFAQLLFYSYTMAKAKKVAKKKAAKKRATSLRT
jgi:hypothetical protein